MFERNSDFFFECEYPCVVSFPNGTYFNKGLRAASDAVKMVNPSSVIELNVVSIVTSTVPYADLLDECSQISVRCFDTDGGLEFAHVKKVLKSNNGSDGAPA